MAYNLNVKLAIRGMARLKSRKSKKALRITKLLLLQMHSVVNFQNIYDVVFWCIFLVAFFTMSRKSNLVITSLNKKVKCLICDNVLIGKHSLLIIFKWSKTNQFGSKYIRYRYGNTARNCGFFTLSGHRVIE